MVNASNAAQDLIGVRYFSTTANYAVGDHVIQGGQIYRANQAVTAGAFNASQWTGFLPLSGGTLTGQMTITAAGTGAQLNVNSTTGTSATFGLRKFASGQANNINGYTGAPGNLRWQMALGDSTAEGTGNVGSNFQLARFDDGGNYLDSPLQSTRSTGAVTLGPGTTPSQFTAKGNLVVGGARSEPANMNPASNGDVFGNTLHGSAIAGNVYWDGTNNRYLIAGYASYAYMPTSTGTFTWGVSSASGAAGAVATVNNVMTLDQTGYLTAYGTISSKPSTGPAFVTVVSTNSSANLNLQRPAGQSALISGFTGTSNRWAIVLGDSSAESGSNAGSNFFIANYNDAGAYITTPLTINRASNLVAVSNGFYVGGVLQVVGNSILYTLQMSNNIFPATDNAVYCGYGGASWKSCSAYIFNNASGRDLKKNIKPLPDCLGLVEAIKPQRFQWKDKSDEDTHWGFIAQDIGAAMDKAGHEFGGYHVEQSEDEQQHHMIRYHELTAVLWKAVQELTAKVARLEAQAQPA
jgi:hypothetical protein